jgi:putative glutamine amidotransferase
MVPRPRILIVGRWSDQIGKDPSQGVYVGRKLIDSVARSGGEPIMVWPDTADRAVDLVRLADGVILPGGNDLDLRPYGVPDVHPKEKHPPAEQDAADVTVARAALDAGLPILAICRGMQVLNVIMGGTIHQHVEETTVEHTGVRHPFDVVPGSLLETVLGDVHATGYSSHHKACKDLAPGLVLNARTSDDIIEGFESPDGRILGVQWHPEIDAADDPVQQRPFGWLTDLALAATHA